MSGPHVPSPPPKQSHICLLLHVQGFKRRCCNPRSHPACAWVYTLPTQNVSLKGADCSPVFNPRGCRNLVVEAQLELSSHFSRLVPWIQRDQECFLQPPRRSPTEAHSREQGSEEKKENEAKERTERERVGSGEGRRRCVFLWNLGTVDNGGFSWTRCNFQPTTGVRGL